MSTAGASSDCDEAEISIALPISSLAALRMSRSRSRNTIVNMSGIASRSTTSALSIDAAAAGSRSLPSSLTDAVLGTEAVRAIASALLRRVGLGGHDQRHPGVDRHGVVDGVELRDRPPVGRLAQLAVGERLEGLA